MSLTTRLLLATFAIVMAGYILESTLHIRTDYAYRTEALSTRVNLLADIHATTLAGPLWNFEREIMTATLKNLMNVPDVLGARVTHADGSVILTMGTIKETGDGAITVKRSIEWLHNGQKRHIGDVTIALSSTQADEALRHGIYTTVAIIVLLIGLVLAAVFFAVRHIIQPLENLNEKMYDIAQGQQNIVIPHLDRDDEIGRIAAAVNTFRDNAVELAKLRLHLEQRVEEQVRDLSYAKDQAEIANRAKSAFMSSMSHELRTPLNAIMGFAQLLEFDTQKYADNGRYRESVRQILLSSHQLLDLIDQVLDFSKIETGNLDVKCEATNLDQIVKTVEDTMQPLAEKYGVTIEHTGGQQWHGQVLVDPMLMRQAIGNLVSNAIKYNRPGGVVELTCTRMASNRARIIVTDSGLGIPGDKHADLFQPFMRLGAEASRIEGTGIGLTITKKLVDAMECAIDFETVVGTGSTFWIDMPIASEDDPPVLASITKDMPASKDAPQPSLHDDGASVPNLPQTNPGHSNSGHSNPDPAPPAVSGKACDHCVLYVEDSPANVMLMQQYFSVIEGGPELIVATTGEEGINMALAQRPSMILMDINLPGISGLETMQQLRTNPDFSSTPIIAISADAMPDEIHKAKMAGFDDYLTKPIKLARLKDVLVRSFGEFHA